MLGDQVWLIIGFPFLLKDVGWGREQPVKQMKQMRVFPETEAGIPKRYLRMILFVFLLTNCAILSL